MSIEQAIEVEKQINENCKPVDLGCEIIPCPSCKSENIKSGGIRDVLALVCKDCKHKWYPLGN